VEVEVRSRRERERGKEKEGKTIWLREQFIYSFLILGTTKTRAPHGPLVAEFTGGRRDRKTLAINLAEYELRCRARERASQRTRFTQQRCVTHLDRLSVQQRQRRQQRRESQWHVEYDRYARDYRLAHLPVRLVSQQLYYVPPPAPRHRALMLA